MRLCSLSDSGMFANEQDIEDLKGGPVTSKPIVLITAG